jgi:DNA-binding XRE family transcriptional regulator
MFKENFRAKMNQLNMTAKDVANAMEKTGYSFGAKEPHRIVQSWIAKHSYLPSVTSGYAIAKSLKTTVEELVDGEAGAEYVRQWARNQGGLWEPPPRVAGVMAILASLDEEELAVATGAMRGAIQAMEEAKRGGGKAKAAAGVVAG